ncbi:MAG: hypothetical protein NTY17_00225 [Planctomycetia bacterium]|nr:hypothetical protein [Planctomycetia bacterium]
MSCQDHDPQPWYDELIEYVGLNYRHRDLPAVSPATERRQAVFLARVAITKIIPFYLQYAGLRHLAAGLVFPTDIISAGRAAHDLIDAFVNVERSENEEGGWHPSVPHHHRVADCALTHSGLACFYAMHNEYYEDAGSWCGNALTSAFLDAENPVSREEFDCSPLWDIALSAIIQAQGLDTNDLG